MAFGLGRAGGATVRLAVDDTAFNRDLANAEQKFRRTTNSMEGNLTRLTRGTLAGSGAFSHLGRSIAFASGAFLGAAGFTAVVKDSINAASDLHEQMNKGQVVFGKSSKAVEEFAKTSAKSFGIAEDSALGM